MEPKPVQHYAAPKYPTRRDLMLGAAGFLLTDPAGCNDGGGAEGAKPPAGGTVVAPIFKHGEGRGATGCVVTAPPVFLSEEEAMQIIREELAKHGVKLGSPMTLNDVKIAARVETDFDLGDEDLKRLPKARVQQDEEHVTPLTLNGVDRAKKVAVRVVSEKAYHDLGGVGETFSRRTSSGGFIGVASSGHTYNFHEAAEYVADQLKKQSEADLRIGLLYDPACEYDLASVFADDDRSKRPSEEERETRLEALKARAKAKAFESLRRQSRDFAAWLKQQKVL